MFKKILIANRGEIACRIIHTAKKMDICTVAIYHPVEAQALYVKQADETVCIETTSPRAAYLDIEKIIQAALHTKAEAIHPGYGFLAENKIFAEACHQAGLTFIGPSAYALEVMGQKDRAKQLMQAAGVPTIPGCFVENHSPDTLQETVQAIGFPLLIKAVAGGGGKAMRLVHSLEEFVQVLPVVQREAQQSFADPRVMLEKYLPAARHIEVQVFGDKFKHYVHLFERDCSLQRRYQKIMEETPAENLSATVREGLHQAALTAAKKVEYTGAGTVEFLVANQAFYFLEMNTRLQVEHPVTELITGVDLVEWQIRVAAGEPLPLTQEAIKSGGHAIEVRICAEDPAHDFLPAIGQVETLHYPAQNTNIRIENGIQISDKITPYFDSLLAKLIVKSPTRALALQNLQKALQATKISGVITNVEFLQQLIDYLQQNTQTLTTQSLPEIISLLQTENLSPWEQKQGWRLNTSSIGMISLLAEQEMSEIHHTPNLEAPMPGIIVQVYVQEGQNVAAGDRLLALEAMKMEHTIRAPNAGTIHKLYYKTGDLVNVGTTLIEFMAHD